MRSFHLTRLTHLTPCTLTLFFWTVPPDDDHWVIDTDYDNYAVHYACRELDTDGTCLDDYSFIFSRHPTGLRPEDQPIVTQKKQEICLLGKYRRVAHSGKRDNYGFLNKPHRYLIRR